MAVAEMNVASALPIPQAADQALDMHRNALFEFRLMQDKRSETVSLIHIGRTLHASGQYVEATAHFSGALSLAHGIGAAQEEAQAARGLGMAELRSGRTAAATEHLVAALAVATDQGTGERAHCHAALAELYDAHRPHGSRNSSPPSGIRSLQYS